MKSHATIKESVFVNNCGPGAQIFTREKKKTNMKEAVIINMNLNCLLNIYMSTWNILLLLCYS